MPSGPLRMQSAGKSPTLSDMASYAVSWRGPAGSVISGKLELRSRTVFIEGSNGHAADNRHIPYEDLAGVRVARGCDDCISGRPTLVLEHRDGERICIGAVGQPGVVMEIADQIAAG